jgi:gamma-glutamyltranspeptidase/glutathione hydrolase
MKGARRIRRIVVLLLAGLIVPPAGAVGYAVLKLRATILRTVPAPESPTGLRVVAERRLPHAAVVAAHPEAARIGAAVLRAGGSAVDAAVAVQATLTLVEPQSSGIGGGAFLLYYDARTGRLTAFDGRETAPASARPELFLDERGRPMSFPTALLGGRSVGVPGVLRMLELAHRRYGRLPWARLFDDAAALADGGFAVTPRLHSLVDVDPVLPLMPGTRDYFFGADGWPLPVGARLVNRPLAATLRAIAAGGADAFYTGPIAADVVAAVHAARRPTLVRGAFDLVARQLGVAAGGAATVDAAGGLDAADVAGYRAIEREPVCVPYRRYRVCAAPPPAGGVGVLQLLRLVERFDLARYTPASADEAHLLVDAGALVEADRTRWLADPAFADVPTEGLLDTRYLDERGRALSPARALGAVTAGLPPGAHAEVDPGPGFEVPSTSHFVIVDGDGSVACMTTSIEFGFGSHVMVRGFLLNNQLTDFAFAPEKDGHRVANAVAAGKRPRSAMSPVVVLDGESGKPLFAIGSPGGPRIIGYVAEALVALLDHHLSPEQAVSLPHVLYAGGKAEVEDVGWPAGAREPLIEELRRRGHEVSVGAQNSGLHAVAITPDGIAAGIDPRREGAAEGQ